MPYPVVRCTEYGTLEYDPLVKELCSEYISMLSGHWLVWGETVLDTGDWVRRGGGVEERRSGGGEEEWWRRRKRK